MSHVVDHAYCLIRLPCDDSKCKYFVDCADCVHTGWTYYRRSLHDQWRNSTQCRRRQQWCTYATICLTFDVTVQMFKYFLWGTCNHCFIAKQDRLLKPLGGYVGYNSEWRELAQVVSRVRISVNRACVHVFVSVYVCVNDNVCTSYHVLNYLNAHWSWRMIN